MASKDAGRIRGITRSRITHDAEAFASVTARHGSKSGSGGSAEYADRSLAPDTMAVRMVVPPENAGSTALGRVSHDAEAFAFVIPEHGAKPGAGRYADHADATFTADALAIRALVTPNDAGRIARLRFPYYAKACARMLAFHRGRSVTGRFADYAGSTDTMDTRAFLAHPHDAGVHVRMSEDAFASLRMAMHSGVMTGKPPDCPDLSL